MAYKQKYKTSWYDWYGRLNEVYLREKDYTGSEEIVQVMDPPISLELNEANEDPYSQAIRGSVVRLNLEDNTGFKFLSILTVSNKQYQVVWRIEGLDYWIGWVAPSEFQHPYSLAPYGVQITATDGLATLKSFNFTGTGKKSLMNILGICLSKIATGFQGGGPGIGDRVIYLYENINKYETNHNKTNADSPLTQTYLDCDEVFYDNDGVAMNCYDVVNKVLFNFGVELRMSDGAWHIIQLNIVSNTYIRRKYRMLGTATNYTYSTYESYNPVLETTRGDVGKTTMNTMVVGGSISTLRALKTLKLTQNFGKRESVLKNCSFKNWVNAYQLEDWTNSGGVIYWRDEEGVEFGGNNPQYHSRCISQAVLLTDSSTVQKIFLRFKGTTNTFESLGGDYYSSNRWSWVLLIRSGSTYKYWSADDHEWKGSYFRQEEPMQKGENSFERIYRTDYLPCEGTLSLAIFAGQPFSSNSATLILSEVELSLYQTDFEYPEDYKFNQVVGVDNLVSEEYESSLAESPLVNISDVSSQIDNGFVLYKNLFLWKDGSVYRPTGSWDYVTGSNPQQLIQKLISEIGSYRTGQNLRIGVDVYSKSLRPISVLKDMSGTSLRLKRFMVSNGTYDGLTGKWSVELLGRPMYEILAAKDGKVIKTKGGKSIVIR